jgi:hypothetical protein
MYDEGFPDDEGWTLTNPSHIMNIWSWTYDEGFPDAEGWALINPLHIRLFTIDMILWVAIVMEILFNLVYNAIMMLSMYNYGIKNKNGSLYEVNQILISRVMNVWWGFPWWWGMNPDQPLTHHEHLVMNVWRRFPWCWGMSPDQSLAHQTIHNGNDCVQLFTI